MLPIRLCPGPRAHGGHDANRAHPWRHCSATPSHSSGRRSHPASAWFRAILPQKQCHNLRRACGKYLCMRPRGRPVADIATDAPPDQTIHPAKIPSPRCSQSGCEDQTFPNPIPVRLLQLTAPPIPALLRGCVHEKSRDVTPNTRRKAPMLAATLHEKPLRTCDGTPALHWPGSPDNCCGWPLGLYRISPAGRAWHHIVAAPAHMASTAGGWMKISETCWRPAGKRAPQPSPRRRRSRYEYQCALVPAWAAHPQPTAARPSYSAVCVPSWRTFSLLPSLNGYVLGPRKTCAKWLILTCQMRIRSGRKQAPGGSVQKLIYTAVVENSHDHGL